MVHGERLKIYPEIFRNHFRLQNHFPRTLSGNPGALQHQVSSNQAISQQKMGTQPVHHITNLQTMCLANFRIWLRRFDHNQSSDTIISKI